MPTVLIVDDEPNVRTLLRRIVESLGCVAVEAEDAVGALKVLADTKVDVAFVDVRLPGPDGIWLADQILERFPRTLIVLATGVQEMDPRVTLRPGVIAYLVKPFQYQQVADVIRRGLETTGRA